MTHTVAGTEADISAKQIVITLDKNYTKPITMTSTYAGEERATIIIHAEEGTRAVINRTITGSGNISEQVMIIAQNAHLTINENHILTEESTYSQERTSTIKDSQFYTYCNVTGAKENTIKTYADLTTSSAIQLATIHMNKSKKTHLVTTHQQRKDCTTNMIIKAVVDDCSEVEHDGLVIIDADGEGSAGFQQTDILLNGRDAKGKSKPELEINNPDVECSHGSTVGSMNPEHLFYLQSKGLGEEQAKQLITNAFLSSILQNADESWQGHILTILRGTEHET